MSHRRLGHAALLVLFALYVSTHLHANFNGPPPGHTGAPGEGTCANIGCHASFGPNSRGTLATDLRLHNWPVQDTLRVVASVVADSTFIHGFQVTVLDTTGGPVGDLFPLDSLTTQITVDSSGRQYAGHTALGVGDAMTSKTWTVLWAPSADTEVTIVAHASAVMADSSGTPLGDWVLLGADTLTYTPGTCVNICGDVDDNGSVTAADIISLSKFVNYAFLQGGFGYLCSDMDGHDRLNLRDQVSLVRRVFHDGPEPICPPSQPEYELQPSSDFTVLVNAVWPADSATVRIYPEFRATAPYSSISSDFYIDVEGELPFVAGWLEDTPAEAGWESQYIRDPFWGSETAGVVMITYHDWSFSTGPPATYPLGWIDLELPARPYPRRINYLQAGYPATHNRPMMVDGDLVGWEMQSEPYLVRLPGDANADDEITAADVIWLVNYTFKGSAPPYPFAAVGDVDCTGTVTAADVIRLVGYVFKSGIPPCDVEADCSFPDLVNWTCP